MAEDNTAAYLQMAADNINTTAQNISNIQNYYDEQNASHLAQTMAWYNYFKTRQDQMNRFVDTMKAARLGGINPYSVVSSGDVQALSEPPVFSKEMFPKGQAPADLSFNAAALTNLELMQAQIRNLDSMSDKNNANEEYFKTLTALKALEVVFNQSRNDTYLKDNQYFQSLLRSVVAKATNDENQAGISADELQLRKDTYEQRANYFGLRNGQLQEMTNLLIEQAKTQGALRSHYSTLDEYYNAKKDLEIQLHAFNEVVDKWRQDIIKYGAENAKNDLEIQSQIINKLKQDIHMLPYTEGVKVAKQLIQIFKMF